MKNLIRLVFAFMVAFCLVGCSPQKENENFDDGAVEMNLEIGDFSFEVDLENNATANALIKLLPLDISMNELNGNEKFFYLIDVLPSDPQKIEKINAGDIMLYGNDCLVIFYKSFSTSYSYTKIGRIRDVTNLQNALGNGDVQVKWSV